MKEEKTIKEQIKKLLLSTNRNGIPQLINAIDEGGFFTSPASTRFHLAYEGGLAIHSLSVYKLFNKMIKEFNLELKEDSIIIVSLLHDLCKIGAYKNNGNNYFWNKEQPKGHAILSLNRIKKFIELEKEEENIIKYHMGFYGTIEFAKNKGEYTLMELVNSYNLNKLCKLFYFCDDMSSQFLEKNDTLV